jgi:hypothetical protein
LFGNERVPYFSKKSGVIMGHYVIGAAAGFLVGVFAPGVARKVKSFFVKEADAAKADVSKKL